MKQLSISNLEKFQGGACERVDYWLGVASGFTVYAGLTTGGFGLVVGAVATGILAAESMHCHGVRPKIQ